MKASRKLSRRSFVGLVSGGQPAPGGAMRALTGAGKPAAPESDHDLAHPAMSGGDPDSAR